MKATDFPFEELLQGIHCENWYWGFEAIKDATRKGHTFKTQNALFSYINTYIKRKKFNDTYYLSRTKLFGRRYIKKSYPLTDALEHLGIDNNAYNYIIENSKSYTPHDELELKYDLSLLGIPDYFIDKLMEGDILYKNSLTEKEQGYLDKCRKAFADMLN